MLVYEWWRRIGWLTIVLQFMQASVISIQRPLAFSYQNFMPQIYDHSVFLEGCAMHRMLNCIIRRKRDTASLRMAGVFARWVCLSCKTTLLCFQLSFIVPWFLDEAWGNEARGRWIAVRKAKGLIYRWVSVCVCHGWAVDGCKRECTMVGWMNVHYMGGWMDGRVGERIDWWIDAQ